MNIEEQKNALAYVLKNPKIFPLFNKALKDGSVISNDFAVVVLQNCDVVYNLLDKNFPTCEEMVTVVNQQFESHGLDVQRSAEEFVRTVYARDVSAYSGINLKNAIMDSKMKLLGEQLVTSNSRIELLEHCRRELQAIGLMNMNDTTCTFHRPLAMQDVENLFTYYDSIAGGIAVPTGFPSIDRNLKGSGGSGLYLGDFMCVMSFTGGGKTTFLLNIVMHMVELGHRVLYFAMDNERFEFAERIYAKLTRVALNADREVTSYLGEVRAAVDRYDSTKFLLKMLQPNKYTTADAAAYIELAKSIYGPIDVVVFDSGDLLRPAYSGYKEKRHDLDGVYSELRGIANNEDGYMRCITTTQSNRKGLTAETMSLEELSESYAKAWHTSLFVALCRNGDDTVNRTARLAVLKNTRGPSNFVIPLNLDFTTMTMQEDLQGHTTAILARRPRNNNGNGNQRRANMESRQVRRTETAGEHETRRAAEAQNNNEEG